MKMMIAILGLLAVCSRAAAQDLSCSGNQCSSTYSVNDKTYTTVCSTNYSGDLSCHTSDPDSHYNPGDGIRSFMDQGMTFEQAAKAEEARHDAVMAESPDELKARHELCDKGVLKPDRCDFSKPHPVGYRVPPPPPPPQFQEGTADELAAAVDAGRASKCFVNTFPVGAEVFVDGVKVGRPDAMFILMKRDKPRKITVKLEGYKTVEKEVNPDGKLLSLGFPLEKEMR